MEKIPLDKIPMTLKSIRCLMNEKYKSSSANRKFNCKCDNCRKWNTLRNFYRKNTKTEYRESQLQSARKWKSNNLDSGRRNESRRRSLKNKNGFSIYTEAQVLELYGSNCSLCGKEIDMKASRLAGRGEWEYGLNIDHVIPISKGGPDTIENVRPSHVLCNIRKGARQ